MGREAYENVRCQIGACGIWCGSCAVGNGTLREAGERYATVLESHGLEHWAPPELDYEALADGLSIVSEIAACVGCRQGGGRGDCEIRACATRRAAGSCTRCDAAGCPHADILVRMREGARSAGLDVKLKSGDEDSWIEERTLGLPKRFPACLLFLDTFI